MYKSLSLISRSLSGKEVAVCITMAKYLTIVLVSKESIHELALLKSIPKQPVRKQNCFNSVTLAKRLCPGLGIVPTKTMIS